MLKQNKNVDDFKINFSISWLFSAYTSYAEVDIAFVCG